MTKVNSVEIRLDDENNTLVLPYNPSIYSIYLGGGDDVFRQVMQADIGDSIGLRTLKDFIPGEDQIHLVRNNINDTGAGLDSFSLAQSENGVLVQSQTSEGLVDVILIENAKLDSLTLFPNGVVASHDANGSATNGNDIIVGTDGSDTLIGQLGDDIISGGLGDDILHGGEGADFLYGGEGNDRMQGDNGQDTILGEAGNDWIHGGDGDDWIFGGDGNDLVQGNKGADYMDGGAGTDTISFGFDSFDPKGPGVYANLETGTADGGTATGDRFVNFENLSGSAASDTLIGDNNNNIIRGLGGSEHGGDYINGQGGNDDLIGSLGDDVIFGGTGNDFIVGRRGNDTLVGEDGDDKFITSTGDSWIFGGAGNDRIQGGLGSDHIDGGSGIDIVNYSNVRAGVERQGINVNLEEGYATKRDGDVDYLIDVENIDGSRSNDILVGDGNNNIFKGDSGNDYIDGKSGNDDLIGGAGDDVIIGGAGNDFIAGGFGDDGIFLGEGTDYIMVSDDRDIAANFGQDTAFDFVSGEDTIIIERDDINAKNITDFAFESAVGVHLDFGKSSLLLENLTLDDLNFDADFIYAAPTDAA